MFEWINHYSGITERETLRRLSGVAVTTPTVGGRRTAPDEEGNRTEMEGGGEGGDGANRAVGEEGQDGLENNREDQSQEIEWWNISPREV